MKIFTKHTLLFLLMAPLMCWAGGEGEDDGDSSAFDVSHCQSFSMIFQRIVCINEEEEKYYQTVVSATSAIITKIKKMPDKYHYLAEELQVSDTHWKKNFENDCQTAAEFAYPLSSIDAKRANDNGKNAVALMCVIDKIGQRLAYLDTLNVPQ